MVVEKFCKLDIKQQSRFQLGANVDQSICIPAKNMPVLVGRFVHFIHSAALLQAVLQANTERFRNGLVETRNRRVEVRKGLGKLLVPDQLISK